LQKFETIKLFWDQYCYKLVLTNRLSNIFREKRFSFTRDSLDQLQQLYDEKEPLVWSRGYRRHEIISEEVFNDAKLLFKFFTVHDDYKLRVEQSTLNIYTNDKIWLDQIANKLSHAVREYWEPDPETQNQLEKGVIVTDHVPDFAYRVTLGQKQFDAVGLATWYRNNTDKLKIGPVLLEELESGNGYVNNMYLYARDEKILQLLSLMCSNIRRVDKIVCKHNLDK
jgi:hypothetical protein